MIKLLLLVLTAGIRPDGVEAGATPTAILVATPRGQARLPVRYFAGGAPAIAAAPLASALGGIARVDGAWGNVIIARQEFRFLLDAPFVLFADQVEPLSAPATVRQDTLYLPLQVVTELLPRLFSERYRYDPVGGRLLEAGTAAFAAPRDSAPQRTASRPTPGAAPRERSGLAAGHLVTIDPGHGGVDPGNPGEAFPRGIREKDVTLDIGLLLRDELKRRGIGVRMTRSTDTLIALGDRGGYCTEACDLFVSIHVNSLKRRRGYRDVRGFETYFLAEAKTEDAARVARMENEAIRFEAAPDLPAATGGLDFILKDLQLNEHLRESARAAELIQESLEEVHDGPNLGVKQAGFMVLTTARRPAILVELGYSTNPDDARLLTVQANQRRLASSLADAIVSYLQEFERKTGTATATGAAPAPSR